ncbi:MAG TPA: hypothetical protein VFM16_03090, partial [Holophagaceae bacterium]|nr:hypothetical protein [Holophagaceae bacterium]
GQGDRARALIEAAVPRAGAGHREELLTRLTQDSLAAADLPRARRAAEQLLAEPDLEDGARLGAVRLLARLSWREKPDWDPAPLLEAQKAKLKPEFTADLYHALAEAADDEGRGAAALPLWIEALNRRTGRDWLQAAARGTRKAGTEPQLLAFFEKQHARSPRDVRWAVAVRDLKRDAHDVAGAIEAAKAAVAVRPEEEILWREATDLLVRAGRVAEAADDLAGWAKPRPADESVAGWRSGLYAQAGQGEKALATERAALAAYRRANPGDAEGLRARLGRAVGRLMEEGLPDLALKLAPNSDVASLDGALGQEDQVRLALLTGQLPRLLRVAPGRPGLVETAGAVVAQTGRVEWMDAAQAFVLAQILPSSGPDTDALNTWWPFVQRAGLEGPVRLALAQRWAAATPGPWQASTPVAFLREVGAARVGRDRWGKFAFLDPDPGRLWVAQLVRADQGEALVAYLQPQWQQALALVEGPTPLNANSARLPWAGWLDAPGALETWARAAAAHAETAPMLTRLMGDRYHWNRFWAVAARGWSDAPLVALLPQETRLAWFRLWDQDTDPVRLARRRTVDAVATALARLVDGQPGAADDPLIVKLRGPRTVGAVLGHDAAWVWPEFAPRRAPGGELAETGDDRVIGQGVDAGRLPGALWGERPGEAWYVLEALARFRQGDPAAPWLPLEAPGRGGETARARLAIRMARALGDVPLALELSARHTAPAGDRAWLADQLALLSEAGKTAEAEALLKQAVLADQPAMTEASFRWFAAQAEDHRLSSPLALLDAAKPVGPAFLAYLQDRQPEAAPRFRTADPEGYLQAQGLRWASREDRLSEPQLRRWLQDLWAQHAADLPRAATLARLSPVWAAARPWLARQDLDRPGALAALDQALAPGGDPSRLLARLTLDGPDDGDRLLAVRVRLARGEDAEALALAERRLGDLAEGRALGFEPVAVATEDTGDEAGEGSADPVSDTAAPQDDALAARLQAWLAPFRQVKRAQAFEAKVRAFLQARRAAGPVSAGLWTL